MTRHDADLARKLGEASVTKNQINPCSTISDQCNLASNRVPSLLAEQGGTNSDVDIQFRFGRAVHPSAEDNALNGVPNDAVLIIRIAISDAVREARMEQNQGTLMQQSTFDTLLSSKLQEALMEQNQGTLMQQSTFDTLLAMQLQFIRCGYSGCESSPFNDGDGRHDDGDWRHDDGRHDDGKGSMRQQHHHHQRANGSTMRTFTSPDNLDIYLSTVFEI
jgi:hypothetical protein